MPLSNEDISKLLGQAAVYGNNSFIGDYRNAHAMLGTLNGLDRSSFEDPTYYGKMSSGLRGQMGNSVAGMAISGLSGLTSIASNAIQAGQIADTSAYENELKDYADFGNYNYVNYDQLANDMSQNYLSPMPTYKDIRGMGGGEKAGNILSSGLQGAQMGMQIGGPIGAAVGGAAGLLASGIGVKFGDRAADRKEAELKGQALVAQSTSNQNFQAAHERIGDLQNRNKAVNSVAKGGPIDRKQSITQYANKVLGKPVAKEHNNSHITRTSVDGGTRVRIRVK